MSAERIEFNRATVEPLSPPVDQKSSSAPARTADGKTFEDVLRTRFGAEVATPTGPVGPIAVPEAVPGSSIKWSAHAEARLRQRGIELSPIQHARLETAVDKAAGKGAKDALVMLDDTAMVVSVQNRTVITALGMHQAKDNVFTNIDSAVIA
ncbi:MAG: flagellar biosynthesis protein [Thermoleophilia bacterium]|nr:flagellar biosynthesis protein [Thermoleophilia bacterium]